MPLNLNVIEKRAVKTGVKQSKKLGHLISPAELLAMRVQIVPIGLRIFLFLAGTALITAGFYAWPSDALAIKTAEVLAGIMSLLFGIFGIRRTLSNLLDSLDVVNPVDVVGGVIDLIGEAISSIDL